MQAHAADLRAEIAEDEPGAAQLVEALTSDWREAQLDPRDRALCAYAEKLTRAPAQMSASDVAALREVGLGDVEIHDAIQVTAYFNYINRVADAVDVELEPEMAPHPNRPR